MRKARVLLFLLLFLTSLQSLYAEALPEPYHIIAYYSIEVDGKSNEELIKPMIDPPGGDPPFLSQEAMIQVLDTKRDKLENMRIFTHVRYTFEAIHVDEIAIRYRVRFFIEDALTFVAVPYPKYDSNYGFMFGLKSFDRNLFGSFADFQLLINATQIAGNWSDLEWMSELLVTDIPIGKSHLHLAFSADAMQRNRSFQDFSWTGSVDWNGIPAVDTFMSLHVAVEENEDAGRTLDASARWEGLPWINSFLTVSPSILLDLDEMTDQVNVDSASFKIDVDPIRINGERYLLSHTLTLKFPHESIRSSLSLSLVDATLFGIPVSFLISSDNLFDLEERRVRDNTFMIRTGFETRLPFDGIHRSSYAWSVRESFDTILDRIPLLSTIQDLTFGTLNWRDNLRQGMLIELSAKADYALFTREITRLDHLNYIVEGEIDLFLRLGQKMGVSSRIIGLYAHTPAFDWYEDQKFPTFFPDYPQRPPELMRGILNTTYEGAVGTEEDQKLGAVANIDVAIASMRFPGADGFISLFGDIGIFTETGQRKNDIESTDLRMFKTIGCEGIVILDKYPSYPVRGSLGFNLDDVIDHTEGKIGFSDIEFELTLGMGLHY